MLHDPRGQLQLQFAFTKDVLIESFMIFFVETNDDEETSGGVKSRKKCEILNNLKRDFFALRFYKSEQILRLENKKRVKGIFSYS